jgi:ubiquinone biosynthesis protein Coq4
MGCGASSNKVCPVVIDAEEAFEKKFAEMQASFDSVDVMHHAAIEIITARKGLMVMLTNEQTRHLMKQRKNAYRNAASDGLLSIPPFQDEDSEDEEN